MTCENTVGSYSCSCGRGLELNQDQRSCKGILLFSILCSKDFCNCVNYFTADDVIGAKFLIKVFQHHIQKIPHIFPLFHVNRHYIGGIFYSSKNSQWTEEYFIVVYFLIRTDINECAVNSSCDHDCHNTPGSFLCSCRFGYRLADDGLSCEGQLFHTVISLECFLLFV